MNFFEHSTCNHEYVYVDNKLIRHGLSDDEYYFRFICKKCREEKFISSLRIENTINKFQSKLNEKIVLDDYIDTSKTKINIPVRRAFAGRIITVKGYVADMTIEYFKRNYGVDISQIKP